MRISDWSSDVCSSDLCSEAGLEQMTRAMALEWARYGIRVNALAPGYISTPLNSEFFASDLGKALIRRIPQRRLGTPADLEGALQIGRASCRERVCQYV